MVDLDVADETRQTTLPRNLTVDWALEDGLEILQFQIMSLCEIPPEEQLLSLPRCQQPLLEHSFQQLGIVEGDHLLLKKRSQQAQHQPAPQQVIEDQSMAIFLQEHAQHTLASCCSKTLTPLPAKQPGYACGDTLLLCVACATTCHPGRRAPLSPQQSAFVCMCGQRGECLFASRVTSGQERMTGSSLTWLQGYLERTFEQQQGQLLMQSTQQMERRIAGSIQSTLEYELPSSHAVALGVVPIPLLRQRQNELMQTRQTHLATLQNDHLEARLLEQGVTGDVADGPIVPFCLFQPGTSPPALLPHVHDDQFSASGSDLQDLSACRLDNSSCWVVAPVPPADNPPWVQVDLTVAHLIQAIALQSGGSGSSAARAHYVTWFRLHVSADGHNWRPVCIANPTEATQSTVKWKGEGDLIPGVREPDSSTAHCFQPPIRARFVRFLPAAFVSQPALRWEIYGQPVPTETSACLEPPSLEQCDNDRTSACLEPVMTSLNPRQLAWTNRPWRVLLQSPAERQKEFATAQQLAARHREDVFVEVLSKWYTLGSFFKWYKAECPHCKGTPPAKGRTTPNKEERMYGAGTVEVYHCAACNHSIRFPRYNHAAKILQTRTGRCGEHAQGFTLICRALGLPARMVTDWTDHVWTEYWSTPQQRWVHVDGDQYDNPYNYESGWNKKLTYIIACSSEEVVDVTRRYTRQYDQVLKRRTLCSEKWLSQFLATTNAFLVNKAKDKHAVACRQTLEQAELELGNGLQHTGKDPDMGKREAMRGEEGEAARDAVPSHPDEKLGRQTGSIEWRRARGELGEEVHGESEHTKSEKEGGNPPQGAETQHLAPQQVPTGVEGKVGQRSVTTTATTHATPPATTAATSMTTTTAAAAATATAHSKKSRQQAEAKAVFQAYWRQVTLGCGRQDCDNVFCYSCPRFSIDKCGTNPESGKTKKALLVRACLWLTKTYRRGKLCPPS